MDKDVARKLVDLILARINEERPWETRSALDGDDLRNELVELVNSICHECGSEAGPKCNCRRDD